MPASSDNRPIRPTDLVFGHYRERVEGTPEEGTPFGRYRLIELLGRGGMGEVWRAHDTAIDRVVALKMLLPHYAKDPDFEQRFRREARAAARLDDSHVVPIYDVGEIDDRLYVTLRLINGTDLQTLIDAGPLEPKRAVAIVDQIAVGHIVTPPPRPSERAAIPAALDQVIATGLAKQPADRYSTTVEMDSAAKEAVTGSASASAWAIPAALSGGSTPDAPSWPQQPFTQIGNTPAPYPASAPT